MAFDLPALIEDHPDYAGVPVICARELWLGAREGSRASALLRRLARSMIVRLTAHGGRTELVGPRALVELVAHRAAARPSPAP